MPSSQSSNLPKHIPIKSAGLPLWNAALILLLRVAVGAVFVISGFAKAIDPWGTVYKMGEYLDVWGVALPHSLLVASAVCLSTIEFLSGVMLFLGCYRRSIVVLMLVMMAGMLPLTLYIYLENPVADCGCFGDLWVISNAATFWKNVAITAALIWLLKFNKQVRCAVSPYVQWMPLALSTLYPLALSLYGYQVQPMLDFRQYGAGRSLVTDPEADGADEVVTLIYEKDGKKAEFALASLPDSTWTYVDRKITSASAGKNDALGIFDADGVDVTSEVLASKGSELLVCIPSLKDADISYTYYLNELERMLKRRNVPMIGIIGGNGDDIDLWKDMSMAEYPVYNSDILQIKELVRGNVGIVALKDGKVLWKCTAGAFLTAMDLENSFEKDNLSFLNANNPARSLLNWLTVVYLSALFLIIAVNNGVLIVISVWRRAMAKKINDVMHHQKK